MRWYVVLSLCASCGPTGPRPDVDGGAGGGTTSFLPRLPPVLDTFLFGAGTTKLLADVSNARVELDPTQSDALTALGECADLLSYCYAPPSVSLAQCFDGVRLCATSSPWNEPACCPLDCRTAFTREVEAGLSPNAALEKVLFTEPDCFPGVRAALEAP